MSDNSDLPEKIGTAINQLDIDFSQLTIIGWIVNLLSLCASGGVAYLVCSVMIQRNGLNVGVGLTFFVIMIAVTTIVFLFLRWLFGLAGLSVTKTAPR